MTATGYQCGACLHPFYEHRESREWQLLNPRRKRNLTGCTREGCECQHADESHVHKPAAPSAQRSTMQILDERGQGDSVREAKGW